MNRKQWREVFLYGFAFGVTAGTHLMAFALILGAFYHKDWMVLTFMVFALVFFWIGRWAALS